jgi:hypothetical protein
MKIVNALAAGILCLATACHPTSDQKREEKIHNGTIADHEIKKIDSARLIIPGDRAGDIYIGQDMQDVFSKLGNADDGDAAMGSALGIWYTKSNSDSTQRDPLTIFSSYRDSAMVVKVVKQLSVSAHEFSTTDGIHTGLKLADLKAVYPGLKPSMKYVNEKTKDTLSVYDEVHAGIAFDIQQDTCSAITIHPKDKPANSTYLPVHPGWKTLI